ncbi:hypothetical protein JCM10207_003558 [Rhodosporidiobolus poonsookiae]
MAPANLPPDRGGTPATPETDPPSKSSKRSRLIAHQGEDDTGMFEVSQQQQQEQPGELGGALGGEMGSSSPRNFSISLKSRQLADDNTEMRKRVAELEQQLAEAVKAKEDAEKRVESLERQLEDRLRTEREEREAMQKAIEERLRALEQRADGHVAPQRAANGSVLPASTADSQAPSSSTTPTAGFPTLQEAAKAPAHASTAARPVSYAAAAARYPTLSQEQFSLFHRSSPPPLPAANLVNDGSDLTAKVERIYLRRLKREQGSFAQIKAAFHACRIPLRSVVSMDFIGTRETATTGDAILEVVVARGAAAAIKRMLVQRLGATLLDGFRPDQAADPAASSERRGEILVRYLRRMKAHAERKEAPTAVRRLFYQWYQAAGGGTLDISLLTDAEKQQEAKERGDVFAGGPRRMSVDSATAVAAGLRPST